jgi:hypothetical protein
MVSGPVMNKRFPTAQSWLSKYRGSRLIVFLLALAILGGAVAGVLGVLLQQHFDSSNNFLLQALVRSIGIAVPLFSLFTLHKTGRDGWLVKPEYRDDCAQPIKTSNRVDGANSEQPCEPPLR